MNTDFMKKNDLNWFADRIGKTIFKTPNPICDCPNCQSTTVDIENFDQAEALNQCQEDLGIHFFDTLTELNMFISENTHGLDSPDFFVGEGEMQGMSKEDFDKLSFEDQEKFVSDIVKARAYEYGIDINRIKKHPYYTIKYTLENDWKFMVNYNPEKECFVVESKISISEGEIIYGDALISIAQDLEINEMVCTGLNDLLTIIKENNA